MLAHLLTELSIGDISSTLDVRLHRFFDGTVSAHGQQASSFTSFVAALNKLAAADAGGTTPLDDSTLKMLSDDVVTVINSLPPGTIDDPALETLLQVIALLRASFKIDELIKSEMTMELIDKILNIYLDVINVFKHMPPHSGVLLSRVSFISPLLITISFSFKLQYARSTSLLKTLAVLFNYHLIQKPLLHETVKMFSINNSTNLDVFEVFNKLWEKTLEVPDQQSLDVRFAVGPMTLLNRIEYLNDMDIGLAVLDQILPFMPNQALSKLAKDTVSFYSCLSQLDESSGVSAFLPLLDHLSTNMDSELLLCLIRTLQLEDVFLSLYESTEHALLMEHIFFKIGNCVAFTNTNATTSTFLSKILDADIIDTFSESKYARYKMIFELIDHNYKTDFSKDFQMVISLEGALAAINSDFSLIDEHNSTVEFGSTFSMEALINYTSFIVQTGLLKFVNSHRELPIQFIKTMSLDRFAPLPRSNFLGFSFKASISEKQLTIKNFDRLVNCAHLSIQIMRKVIKGYTESKKYLKIKDSLSGDDLKIDYCTSHMLLEQYYTTLFTVLIISYEMSTKSKASNSTKASMFYDYSSSGNVLKLQVFQTFKDLFKLYGSLAVYELIQFISNIGSQDLELQTFGVVLINHMAFHSDASVFKTHVIENELISKTLAVFVEKWDDGSVQYTQLLDLLKMEQKREYSMIPFTKQIYFNLLGYPTFESPTPSPGHSSMGSNGNNSLSDFNISAASQSTQLNEQNFGLNKTTSFNNNNNGNTFGNNYNYNSNTSTNNFNTNQAPLTNNRTLNNNCSKSMSSTNYNNGSYTTNYNAATPVNYNNTSTNNFNNASSNNFNSTNSNNYQYNDLSQKTSFESVGSMQYSNVNGMDYYKSSNIRNVQSFVPKQPTSTSQSNSSQLPSSQMSVSSMTKTSLTQNTNQNTQVGGMSGLGMQNSQRPLYDGFNTLG